MESDIALKSKVEGTSLGLALLDETHCILFWNDWLAEASGIDPAQALGRPLEQLLDRESDANLLKAVDGAVKAGQSRSLLSDSGWLAASPYRSHLVQVQPIAPGGGAAVERSHCLLSITPLAAPGEAIGGRTAKAAPLDRRPPPPFEIAGLVEATLHHAPEEILRQQKDWLTTLIDAMPDIVCFKDGANRCLVANRFYRDLFGIEDGVYANCTSDELGRMFAAYQPFAQRCAETDAEAWRGGRAIAFEQAFPTQTGQERSFDMLKMPLFHRDGRRKGLVVIGRDVTERKMAAARIHHLAHHDSLTGLPNRTLFQERLRQALAQARRNGSMLGLLLLDLDKFKEVNDTLGHHVGDLLLRAVAKRLRDSVRESDTVARLGGDEFAVLLTNLSEIDGASLVAETIIRAIADPFYLDDTEILTGISVGITLFPDDAGDAPQLLKNADLALYRSKNDGRGRYHFYVTEMDAEVRNRKAIERDLRHALNSDQLTLFYQPLIDLKSGAIIGAEALIRWFHPERGLVPPSEFIPIAERSELIYRLGRWVIERACLQIKEWERAGLPVLQVSVNLSPAQFRHPDLLGMIRSIIEETGVDPRLLQLEITETIAMTNFDYSVQILKELRHLGITIAIDDFGTGYSSLNYLRHFPVDKLKIDRSFVSDVEQYPGSDAIVRAIVSLGHGIGAKVNVEGIETPSQLAMMQGLACDECQGFHFSRPLPAEDYARLISQPVPWQNGD